MLKKLWNFARENYFVFPCVFLIAFFIFLMSLFVLQSDDYFYATFFKDGFINFLNLTCEHFKTFNGRVLVHLFAQLSLSLPHILSALFNSAMLFFAVFFAARLVADGKRDIFVFISIFYTLLLFLGRNITANGIMWVSAFFNYAFPLTVTGVALFLLKSNNNLKYVFLFLAGATTEQWGITACVIVFCLSFLFSEKKLFFSRILPTLVTFSGFVTIFLSPATALRIDTSAHMSVGTSLIDLPRLSRVFLGEGGAMQFFVIFIIFTMLLCLKKGIFKLLYFGILPLFLLVTLPVHSSFMGTFILILLYLMILCFVLFKSQLTVPFALISGAIMSIFIMIPTNTFEPRICLPSCLLMTGTVASLFFAFDIHTKIPKLLIFAVPIISSIAFLPVFNGFYRNYEVEKANLDAIEEARVTKTLNYSIDYDKKYVGRQMFNDGYFYTTFQKLYSLEDCKINIVSASNKSIIYKGKRLDVMGICLDGENYVPVRAFLEETGGSISTESDIVMTLDEKTLTQSKGMLSYVDKNGDFRYCAADKNRLPDFYTLYIKESVLKEAFGY